MQCVLSPPFNVIRKPPYWGGVMAGWCCGVIGMVMMAAVVIIIMVVGCPRCFRLYT